jgi:methyl-accepting chemotaxis protein/sigma-B regulation protein RsbU (phosphoserine phosphatase)
MLKLKLTKKISETLSLRLSLIVACVVAVLLLVSLAVMFRFSRQTLREGAMHNAEETLEATVQDIDNILLSVEQSSGNVYWEMMAHLDKPDRMLTYCRRLVECNRYIVGCAIVFKPNYYPGRELFMAYVHRKGHSVTTDASSELVVQETFANRPYTEQVWYTEPMTLGHAYWTDPLKNDDTEDEALITFCLPIVDRSGSTVGVMAADVAVELLSQIVLDAKPSSNGYNTLLARNGSYIVHPDKEKLMKQNVFSQFVNKTDPSVIKAAKAMVSGESGMLPFTLNGRKWYVLYKPFVRSQVVGRSMEHLAWSVGVVYPEDDIFGDYNRLLYLVLAIAFLGLVFVVAFSSMFTHRQLLPLTMLTETAQQISQGNYGVTVPDTARADEIGQLQDDFRQMQYSLASQITELERLNGQLKERTQELQQANHKAQEADRMKTAFLHQMTNRMLEPSETLNNHVATLCSNYHTISSEDATHEIETIRQQGNTIIDLLDDMIHSANNETGKEAAYD